MKKLLLILLLSAPLFLSAQTQITETPVVIADETEISALKSGKIKIVSSNETISVRLVQFSHANNIVNYTVKTKKDRNGYYVEYTFYFPKEQESVVLREFSKLNTARK